MAQSAEEICNLALGHTGTTARIVSINEGSAEADYCLLFYAETRDEVLAEAPWNFAKREVTLNKVGTAPASWGYQYAYPSGTVTIRSITDGGGEPVDPIPFETGLKADTDERVIWTDIDGARAWVTARITAPAIFPPLFVNALAWKLAAKLVTPIRGDADGRLKRAAEAAYQGALAPAWAAAVRESQPREPEDSALIRARQ